MLEWGVLTVVILVLIGVFGQYFGVVQGQGERAAIQSVLGVLRSTFVVDHATRMTKIATAPVGPTQRNPFPMLKSKMLNYTGEFSMQKIFTTAPGSWVFDPECGCIGYLPLNPQWIEYPPDTLAIWFRVTAGDGPLQIEALQKYVWQGQILK
jgi:hypothetical protein